MKKIFLVLLVLLLSFNLSVPDKASANAALKIAAGSQAEKIMIGVAEKAGVKYATKNAREKALKRWNYDWKNLDQEIDQEIADRYKAFKQTLDTVEPEPLPNKPGWSKVILTSAMFLSGADLIYEGYRAFQNAVEEEKAVTLYADAVESGNMYSKGFGLYYTGLAGSSTVIQWGLKKESSGSTVINHSTPYMDREPAATKFFSLEPLGDNSFKVVSTIIGFSYGSPKTLVKEGTTVLTAEDIGKGANERFLPTPEHVPSVNVPELVPLTIPNEGINSLPDISALPETVEIIIPDGAINPENEPTNEPWNNPLGEPVTELPPDPLPELDPDGDGKVPIDDGTPANPWKNLLPHVWLMALLDLLRAIIEYLVRMFDYILSIPFVEAKPIDNEAFAWFRNTKFLGINPFQVITSFAMIGLAFSVYKIIRKVLP